MTRSPIFSLFIKSVTICHFESVFLMNTWFWLKLNIFADTVQFCPSINYKKAKGFSFQYQNRLFKNMKIVLFCIAIISVKVSAHPYRIFFHAKSSLVSKSPLVYTAWESHICLLKDFGIQARIPKYFYMLWTH